MLQLKRYDESTDGSGDLPPRFFVYVQGNPGTGKTFTTRPILNVIRQVMGAMDEALVVAPAGTTVSLTRGKTTVRAFRIDLKQPVARIDCQYTYKEGRSNHAAKECNMPVRHALCKGAAVMLLEGGGGNAGEIGPDDAGFGAGGVLTSRVQRSLCRSGRYPSRHGDVPEDWTGETRV